MLITELFASVVCNAVMLLLTIFGVVTITRSSPVFVIKGEGTRSIVD